VRLEASTKSQVHQKFEVFWTSIAYTKASLNSKNGPKKELRSFIGAPIVRSTLNRSISNELKCRFRLESLC
jgi:hypothetical protein